MASTSEEKKAISDNKRIAKNTLALYVRTLFIMLINIYASRVILAALGVTDYGVYNVVGGFVAMFTMVSSTMSTATQRFLSFEIGKSTESNIVRLFSTSVMIHVILVMIIFVLAETIGLWFVNYKMVFPEGRLFAANCVYQLSLFTLLVRVISVPYNASLIAYEKMTTFAYVGIVEEVLKLLIIFLVSISSCDRLILYAILLMLLAVSIRLFYGFYVRRNFEYCRCNWKIDKEYRKSLLSFISFNFIGSIAGITRSQGINVLLNLFFGTVVNAARGVSAQVLAAVSTFVRNFQVAMNPQIIKLYAAGDKKNMYKLVYRGSKFSYLIMLILAIPIVAETPYILNLWLVEVPNYTIGFIRLTFAMALVDSLEPALLAAIHASGKVKLYQLVHGTMMLTTLPIAYTVLKLGYSPYAVYIVAFILSVMSHFVRLIILRRIIGFPMLDYLMNVTFKVFVVTIFAAIGTYYIMYLTTDGFLNFICIFSLSVVVTMIVSYIIGLTSREKKIINTQLVRILQYRKKIHQ